MDQNQKTLVELLSLSLKGEKATFELMNSVDWTSISKLAQSHSIFPLLFTAINQEWIDHETLADLKSSFYNIILRQVQNLDILTTAIDELTKANIPLIAIKGLILRDLYPLPETRTMVDFDIVVKEKDFKNSINILKSLGFQKYGHDRMVHVQMIYQDRILLELHRNLFDKSRVNLPMDYMSELWRNAIPVSICNRTVLSFSNLDNLVYLLLHIKKHFQGNGFGLRQLCDITLFVSAKRSLINWEQFYLTTIKFKISRFTQIIFSICNKLFDMAVPGYMNNFDANPELLNQIIQDILEGGIFGNDTEEGYTSIRMRNLIGLYEYKGLKKINGAFKILFPLPDKLDEKYVYARRYRILLPIAWVHRWFYNITHKRQREMLKILLNKNTAKETFVIMHERGKIINLVTEDEKTN